MYAIVQQGGHQYRVAPGDRLLVDQLTADVGSIVALEPVLLLEDDAGTTVGTPTIDGARVAAVVVSHRRGSKVRIFKYKPKKRYRRTMGYRSRLTELRVEALLGKGQPLPRATAAAPADHRPRRSRPAAGAPARADDEATVDESAAASAAAPAAPKRARTPAPAVETKSGAEEPAAETARRRSRKPATPAEES